ncbi:hypothetical protein AAHA92_06416 [Salvia divinorum]|uniref:Uncharacterized protein n=1 Tax=Salvia divinorum TaxID=28513 RepID=A0ABD1I6N4_SALDI
MRRKINIQVPVRRLSLCFSRLSLSCNNHRPSHHLSLDVNPLPPPLFASRGAVAEVPNCCSQVEFASSLVTGSEFGGSYRFSRPAWSATLGTATSSSLPCSCCVDALRSKSPAVSSHVSSPGFHLRSVTAKEWKRLVSLAGHGPPLLFSF